MDVKERRILVAVDESEESMYALQWCLANLIQHSSKDTIILVYARPPPPVYSPIDGTENGSEHHIFGTEEDFVPNLQFPSAGFVYSEDVTASIEKYSKEIAESIMEKAKNTCQGFNNIKVDIKVSVGDARDVICSMVDKLGADMLVIGSHGYGFIKRALLGSVSDHCARNAKCPVLIVKRH